MFRWLTNSLFAPLSVTARQSAKRVPQTRAFWGMELEQLESRALLSAAAMQVDDPAPAEVIKLGRKNVVVIPSVQGQWNVNVSGASHPGTAMATVTQTGTKGTISLSYANFDSVTFVGKLNTKNQFIGSAKVPLNGKNVTVKITATFGAGASPTTFTGVVKQGSKVRETLTGTKL